MRVMWLSFRIGERCHLYDPDSEGGLADALRHVVEASDRLSQMGRCNRERVANWTWENMARMTVQLYQRSVGDACEGRSVEGDVVKEELL